MTPGLYRAYLVAPDGNWLSVYLPLDDNGNYDHTRPHPALLKSRWGDIEYLGELRIVPLAEDERWNRIWWGASSSDSLTNLLREPIAIGQIVRVHQSASEEADYWDFEVRELIKL